MRPLTPYEWKQISKWMAGKSVLTLEIPDDAYNWLLSYPPAVEYDSDQLTTPSINPMVSMVVEERKGEWRSKQLVMRILKSSTVCTCFHIPMPPPIGASKVTTSHDLNMRFGRALIVIAHLPSLPFPPLISMPRTTQTARQSTGGKAPHATPSCIAIQAHLWPLAIFQPLQPSQRTAIRWIIFVYYYSWRWCPEQRNCYICINGGNLYLCDHCPHAICSVHIPLPAGVNTTNSTFICPACHISIFSKPIQLIFHFHSVC